MGALGDGNGINRAMLAVQQAIIDKVYAGGLLSPCSAPVFKGRGWLTAKHVPGDAPPPSDDTVVHTVKIQADVPRYWGRKVSFVTLPARKPTGVYLSPGGIGTVTVPSALVNNGFQVLVGGQTIDHSAKKMHRRLDRVTVTYDIKHTTTYVANPLGGALYIVVPYLAAEGLVEVQISGGVILSPLFQRTRFNQMSNADWAIRKLAPGPWADFETDKFMLTVPSSWVNRYKDPVELMRLYDLSMDGTSEWLGYPPEKRNRKVLYLALDVQQAHSTFGIGYPQVNNIYNPRLSYNGNVDHWMLRDPKPGWPICWHELAHAQDVTGYKGEHEAIVNYLYTFIAHTKFNVNFNKAFNDGQQHDNYDPDDAAVHWMITENFRNGREMDRSATQTDQTRYQNRGHGKYADITRLFGWEVFTSYYHQKNLDANARADPPDSDMDHTDARTLHLSVAAKYDLTPLIQFWGRFAVDEHQLQARIQEKGLPPSEQVRCLLVRYRGSVPLTNDAFLAFFNKIYPGMDCRSFESVMYGKGWYCDWKDRWGNNGEGTKALERIDFLLQKYFPGKTGASCVGVNTGARGEDVPRPPPAWSWMPTAKPKLPIRTCSSVGDPHLTTFTGRRFDNHVAGWTVLYKKGSLEIQVEQAKWRNTGVGVAINRAVRYSTDGGRSWAEAVEAGSVMSSGRDKVFSEPSVRLRVMSTDYSGIPWARDKFIYNVYISTSEYDDATGMCGNVHGQQRQLEDSGGVPFPTNPKVTKEQAERMCAFLVSQKDPCVTDIRMANDLSVSVLIVQDFVKVEETLEELRALETDGDTTTTSTLKRGQVNAFVAAF